MAFIILKDWRDGIKSILVAHKHYMKVKFYSIIFLKHSRVHLPIKTATNSRVEWLVATETMTHKT